MVKTESERAREKIHSSRGVVLRRVKHLEKDVRVTILLRDMGKVLVLAKGGQEQHFRLKSLLEPFTEAHYHVFLSREGLHGRLIGGKLMASYRACRLNLDAFRTACKACETADLLLPFRTRAAEVYDVLHSALTHLQKGWDPHTVWVFFGGHVLKVLGHGNVFPEMVRFYPSSEWERVTSFFKSGGAGKEGTLVRLSRASVERCVGVVNARLERILPRRLKSDVLAPTG